MPNYFGPNLRRDDLVKKKERKPVEDPHDANVSKYCYCQLTSAKLKRPIVASRLGKLYNKDAVLEYLIDRGGGGGKDQEDKLEGVKSLKDVFEVKLANNSEYNPDPNDSKSSKNSVFPFSCGITSMEMNGSQKFVFSTLTKNVVSEKALRESNYNLFVGYNEMDSDGTKLHPMYDQSKEDKLVDPVTTKPFGRPILLYPSTALELAYAQAFQPGKKKKKKSSGSKDEASDPKKIKQRETVSTINLSSVKKVTGDVMNSTKKSKAIDKYRDLKLIGDTRQNQCGSASSQLYSTQRSYTK